jgi:tRNA-dihydrouridine synthase B
MTQSLLRPWSLGSLQLDGPLVLGPMAGYTSLPLRVLCRRAGADLVVSEMVSAQAIRQRNHKTFELMATCDAERPVAIQLFGGDPQVMAEAVAQAEAAGADAIDINMGCTVPKVLRSEGGAALLTDPERAVEVAAAVVERARVPVTCKIRAGQYHGDESYLELARRLEGVGVAGIALHARTVRQRFTGDANHSHTRALVETLSIPVIASGDVFTASRPREIMEETGCAAVMYARGMVGRPWVFAQARAVLAGEVPPRDPDAALRFGIALCHAQMLELQMEPRTAMHQMRGQFVAYTRGLIESIGLKRRFSHVQTLDEVIALFQRYLRGERD